MLIQNAVKITEDDKITYLISSHGHHYNSYTFKDGSSYAVDGGNEYIRRGYKFILGKDKYNIENYSLDDEMPFDIIKEKLLWGSYGQSGQKILTFLPIKDLTLEHLKNILREDKKEDNDSGKVVRNLFKMHKKVIKHWVKEKSKK